MLQWEAGKCRCYSGGSCYQLNIGVSIIKEVEEIVGDRYSLCCGA